VDLKLKRAHAYLSRKQGTNQCWAGICFGGHKNCWFQFQLVRTGSKSRLNFKIETGTKMFFEKLNVGAELTDTIQI
jgi:hypothetical protein